MSQAVESKVIKLPVLQLFIGFYSFATAAFSPCSPEHDCGSDCSGPPEFLLLVCWGFQAAGGPNIPQTAHSDRTRWRAWRCVELAGEKADSDWSVSVLTDTRWRLHGQFGPGQFGVNRTYSHGKNKFNWMKLIWSYQVISCVKCSHLWMIFFSKTMGSKQWKWPLTLLESLSETVASLRSLLLSRVNTHLYAPVQQHYQTPIFSTLVSFCFINNDIV